VNGCSVMSIRRALYALYAYTHTVPTGNHTLTHMCWSFVSDPKLDGMVPFKLLPWRSLLERGGKSEEGVESRSEYAISCFVVVHNFYYCTHLVSCIRSTGCHAVCLHCTLANIRSIVSRMYLQHYLQAHYLPICPCHFLNRRHNHYSRE
jgi:hypothetical protein